MFKTSNRFTPAVLALLLIPGFVAPPAQAGEKPAASLVIPYFEVSANPSGKSTIFSISNADDAPAIAHVTLWTSYWQPTLAFDVVLAAHDVATYNVRDLLNGTIPATDPLGQTGCSSYPSPAFDTARRQTLWEDHQGKTCIGADTDDLAVGIVTIDLVRQCSALSTNSYAGGTAVTPLSAGYFANGGNGLALNRNILLSDFHLIDPLENYAQGDTAFHLHASSEAHPAGGSTFYSGLGSLGADNRESLSSVLYGRVINGGPFTGGTQMVLLRQPQNLSSWSQLECGRSPWTDEQNRMDMLVLDEQGHGFLSQRPLEAGTQKVDLKGWQELPSFGALTLRSAEGGQLAGLVLHSASGRFGTGFKMQAMGNDAGDGGLGAAAAANAFHVDFTHEVNGSQASFQGACYNGQSPSATCTVINWFFGDGASGGPLATSHIYASGGTYPVTFIAQNEAGQKAARTHMVVIENGGGGGSGGSGGGGGGGGVFSVAFSSLQIPDTLSVAFSGSCFLDGESIACGNPQWTFGDGGTSSLLGPTHLYAAAGTYPVTFTASAAGQTDTATANVTVDAVIPGGDDFQVTFTSLQVPGTLGVQFVGTCFVEGVIAECENPHFAFGDGGTADAVSVLHTYAAAGTYAVSFSANHGEQTDTATANVTVDAVIPGDEFEVHFTSLQVPGTLGVQFVGSCFSGILPVACGNPQWTFGDSSNGTGTTTQHTYATAGTYLVTFTASHNGETDSESASVTVEAVIPGDVFEVSFTALQVPNTLRYQFNGVCFLDGVPVTCENPQWSFGDSTGGNGASVEHTYPAAGTYQVIFTAAHGAEIDSQSANVVVQPVLIPEVFDVSFTSVQTPNTLQVSFIGACFVDSVPVPCENPQWSFGDGDTGNGGAISHTYGAAGNFTVTFTASHDGETDTATATVTVAPIPLVNFVVSFTAVQVPNTLEVQFSGTCFADSLPVPCTNPQWIFGDGHNGTGASVSHTYGNSGLFQVTFTASHGSQTDSHSTSIHVVPANNIPTISSLVCAPNPILGGLISLCLLVVVDLDGDELTYQVDLLGGLGVCLDNGFGCTTTITGQVAGGIGIQIPFSLATNLTQATTATIRAIITDSNGNVSAPLTTTVQVLLNTPPVISVFACVPPVVIGGIDALCSFNLVDLNPGNLTWTVDIIGGQNACLGPGPGCSQTMTGVTNGLLSTINFALRTSPSTTSPVRLRAKANDGLQTQEVEISVIVL